MKKLYFTAVIMMALLVPQLSNGQNDPTKLARVVYSYQTLHFYDSGLISEVRNTAGVLQQDFIYDQNNNLAQQRNYLNGILQQTATFSYTDNRISAFGTVPVTYLPERNSLIYYAPEYNDPAPTTEDDDPIIRGTEWTLNDEGYAIAKDILYRGYRGDYSYGIFDAAVTNGNMLSIFKSDGETSVSWEHVAVVNPLKAACMPVSKVLAMLVSQYSGNDAYSMFLTSAFYSTYLDAHEKYYSEDPESSQVIYELNANGLPFKKYRRHFYQGVYEATTLEATFYYQGDILP